MIKYDSDKHAELNEVELVQAKQEYESPNPTPPEFRVDEVACITPHAHKRAHVHTHAHTATHTQEIELPAEGETDEAGKEPAATKVSFLLMRWHPPRVRPPIYIIHPCLHMHSRTHS